MKKLVGFLVGFRKFTIMILFMLLMTVFRIKGYIEGPDFANTVRDAVVAYFGTNIGEHLVSLGKEWVTGKLKELKGEDK